MQKLGFVAIILLLVALGCGAYGWIHNIVLLTHMTCGWCVLQIVRLVGIFVVPLGAVLGFIS